MSIRVPCAETLRLSTKVEIGYVYQRVNFKVYEDNLQKQKLDMSIREIDDVQELTSTKVEIGYVYQR